MKIGVLWNKKKLLFVSYKEYVGNTKKVLVILQLVQRLLEIFKDTGFILVFCYSVSLSFTFIICDLILGQGDGGGKLNASMETVTCVLCTKIGEVWILSETN